MVLVPPRESAGPELPLCPGIEAPVRVQCCCHNVGPSKWCPSAGGFLLFGTPFLLIWPYKAHIKLGRAPETLPHFLLSELLCVFIAIVTITDYPNAVRLFIRPQDRLCSVMKVDSSLLPTRIEIISSARRLHCHRRDRGSLLPGASCSKAWTTH